MAKAEPTPVPKSLNPSAAAVAVPRQGSSAKVTFLLQANEKNDWPVKEPENQTSHVEKEGCLS